MADLFWERRCWSDQYQIVAGVDEAGRGALAGPIVAAAVVLRPGSRLVGELTAINDSKTLSAATRDRLDTYIRQRALAWSVCEASALEIDTLGINRANRLCMERAIEALGVDPEIVLIDAITCEAPIPQIGLIDGDALSVSIAAASILAKTARDRTMHQLHHQHDCYGFHRHVGYGTPVHLAALRTHGPCEHHRHSFGGVRQDEQQ